MALMEGPMTSKEGAQGGLGGGEVKVYPAPKPADPLSLVKR